MRFLYAFFSLVFPSLVFAQLAPALPPVAAKAYVLSDFNSGQLLVSHNPQQRVEPASLTKLMTAYLAFAALKAKTLKPDQIIPVSPRASKSEGSRMFIEPNPVSVDSPEGWIVHRQRRMTRSPGGRGS